MIRLNSRKQPDILEFRKTFFVIHAYVGAGDTLPDRNVLADRLPESPMVNSGNTSCTWKQLQTLFERAREHPEDLSSQFCDNLFPAIWRLLRRWIRDENDLEDCTQAAVVAIWMKKATYDSTKASFRTWAYTVARRTWQRMFEKRLKEAERLESIFNRKAPNRYSLNHTVLLQEPASRSNHLQELLSSAILQLSERDQQLIDYFYRQQIPQSEIAARLKTTPGAITDRLFRIRERLEKKMHLLMSSEEWSQTEKGTSDD